MLCACADFLVNVDSKVVVGRRRRHRAGVRGRRPQGQSSPLWPWLAAAWPLVPRSGTLECGTSAPSKLRGQGPGLVNVLSLLSGYSRNLHMKVIFNFHTPFHTRTPHCLTRPQAVRVTRRQTVTHPQAVTRPGTGNVHGCPLTTPNRPSRLPPSDPAIHRQADRQATTTHPHHTASATSQSLTCSRVGARWHWQSSLHDG